MEFFLSFMEATCACKEVIEMMTTPERLFEFQPLLKIIGPHCIKSIIHGVVGHPHRRLKCEGNIFIGGYIFTEGLK